MLRNFYSALRIKSLDEQQRVLEGIASTPTSDRAGDVVDALGASFKLPLPFLLHHDKELPIGHVVSATPTKSGIPVRIRMAKTDEPGSVKERLDAAWTDIKLGLIRGLSIGFVPKDYSYLDTGGIHFRTWDWLELSAVTVPANEEASIINIKRFDVGARRHWPVVRLSEASGFRRDQHLLDLKQLAEGYAERLHEVLRPLEQEPDHIALGVLEATQQILSARIAKRKR